MDEDFSNDSTDSTTADDIQAGSQLLGSAALLVQSVQQQRPTSPVLVPTYPTAGPVPVIPRATNPSVLIWLALGALVLIVAVRR